MVTVVGIAGGTGSGKSTFGRRLVRAIGAEHCALVSQDHYYLDLSDRSLEARAQINFDHPDSIDSTLLCEHVRRLKTGDTVEAPNYDFARHIRAPESTLIAPRPVVLVEGILVFVWPELTQLMDLTIYVDAPADVRLARRVRRDIVERGRDVDSVLNQYLATVRPMHEVFVGPTAHEADLIVPGEGDNDVVVQFLGKALRPEPEAA